MSRIDEALSKGRPDAVGTGAGADANADNPWDLKDEPGEQERAVEQLQTPVAGQSVREGHAPPVNDLQMPDIGRRLGGSEAAEKVVSTTLPPDVVEEYRRLAAMLHHIQAERGSQVLMVTSAVAEEGKTLTATNLALTLSGSYGRTVLMIDADLRRPSLHRMFNVTNFAGLSEMLKESEAAPPSLTAISPQLTLLTAGRPSHDPMAALISQRMKKLIEEARTNFDWVIIDTPPVGLLTDASLLAQMVDLAVLVVRAESTAYEQVQRAADAIGRHRITGVVLNRVSSSALGESSRYAKYYGAYTSPRED